METFLNATNIPFHNVSIVFMATFHKACCNSRLSCCRQEAFLWPENVSSVWAGSGAGEGGKGWDVMGRAEKEDGNWALEKRTMTMTSAIPSSGYEIPTGCLDLYQ